MAYVRHTSYQDMPFYTETPQGEFYTYSEIKDLIVKCENLKEEISMCRTMGILQSINGRYYISDIDLPFDDTNTPTIQVSMTYLKTPPPSTAIPYPVQLFGTIQWKKRPVIHAKILQVIQTAIALRLRDVMRCITKTHLAAGVFARKHDEESIET